MTIIFLAGNRVYTDSMHYVGLEEHHSLTKIRKLKEPMPVTWSPREGIDIDDDKYPAAFTDTIHGWSLTGDNTAGLTVINKMEEAWQNVKKEEIKERLNAAIAKAIKKGAKVGDPHPVVPPAPSKYAINLDRPFEVMEQAAQFSLVNTRNHFTLILLGEKASYALGWDGFNSTRLTVLRRDNPTAFGSGADETVRNHFLHHDPIYALYHAMFEIETCGGMIDVWNLPTEHNPVLERAGVCNARTKREIVELLRDHTPDKEKPMQPDFISTKFHDATVEAAMALGTFLGESKVKEDAKPTSVKKKAIGHSQRKKDVSKRVLSSTRKTTNRRTTKGVK
jgi:hypothetical protein